jgi:hypothetical protein
MYDPVVTADQVAAFETHFGVPLPTRTVDECRAMVRHLDGIYDPDAGRPTRDLTRDEQTFISAEILRSRVDFRYWAERYALVNKAGRALEPLYPLWVSQELVIAALAKREREQDRQGGLVTTLKARQLGVSTLSEALLVHVTTLQKNREALIASDVTTSTVGLMEKADLMVRSLPWWLKPAITKRVMSGEHPHIHFDTESKIYGESGKQMRGQKVEDSGESKGEIGRSKTLTVIHLSELATWENPDQIDTALFPAIPWEPYVVGITESTAKGRHNWHQSHWDKAVAGLSRFAPVFIPWGAEPSKYRLPPPAGWRPSADTEAHARKCEAEWPRWLGKPVTLEREQLYWYERERSAWEHDDRLADFLAEYPATPEECFQYSGRSIFSLALRERIDRQARTPTSIWLIEPAALAQERAALVQQGITPSA